MFPENRFMELLIIGALALIVVGPKDLPILMRKVGQFVGRMRAMANEFRASFDELARQSELEELRKEVEAMRVNQQAVMTGLNPLGEGKTVFDDIGQHLAEPTPTFTPAAEPAPVVEFETPVVAKPKAPRAPRAKDAAPKAPRAPRAKDAATPKAIKAPKAASTAKAGPTAKQPAKPRKSTKAVSKVS